MAARATFCLSALTLVALTVAAFPGASARPDEPCDFNGAGPGLCYTYDGDFVCVMVKAEPGVGVAYRDMTCLPLDDGSSDDGHGKGNKGKRGRS